MQNITVDRAVTCRKLIYTTNYNIHAHREQINRQESEQPSKTSVDDVNWIRTNEQYIR